MLSRAARAESARARSAATARADRQGAIRRAEAPASVAEEFTVAVAERRGGGGGGSQAVAVRASVIDEFRICFW